MIRDLKSLKDMEVHERIELARKGERLDELVSDPSYRVRKAVAMQGYGLAILEDDKSKEVRQAVSRYKTSKSSDKSKECDESPDETDSLFDTPPTAEGIIEDKVDITKVSVSGCDTGVTKEKKKICKHILKTVDNMKGNNSKLRDKILELGNTGSSLLEVTNKISSDISTIESKVLDTIGCLGESGKIKQEDNKEDGIPGKPVKKRKSKKTEVTQTGGKKKDTKKKEVGVLTETKTEKKAKPEIGNKSEAAKPKLKAAKKEKDIKEVVSKTEENIKEAVPNDNRPIDLLVSFDTTGSMYPVLRQVRNNINMLVTSCFKDMDNVRIAIIAHGDYCDAGNPYTIKLLDFTDDEDKIKDFVENTESTYGGDADECYELVLNVARQQASWRKDSKKVLMVIGDANPHGVNYPDNEKRLSWGDEAKELSNAGVVILGVHAMAGCRKSSYDFYKTIADISGGKYLQLDNFSEITDLIVATCYSKYSEVKLNEYVSVIRSRGGLSRSLANNIQKLSGIHLEESMASRCSGISGLEAVVGGRFQVMEVYEKMQLKQFISDNGITFKTGKTFYLLSKPEKVQQYKEIILQDKNTGEYFTGDKVREILGLAPRCLRSEHYITEKIKPDSSLAYNVFVQSTSYNRNLVAGTRILYEVSDWDRIGAM